MNALVQVVVIVVKVVSVVINCCSREDGGGDGAGIHHQHSCHYQYVITEAVTVCQFSFLLLFHLSAATRSYAFVRILIPVSFRTPSFTRKVFTMRLSLNISLFSLDENFDTKFIFFFLSLDT